MNITTKFDIGQTVYPITQGRKKTWIPCEICDGTGRATLKNDQTISCPTCYGRLGDYLYAETQWDIRADAISAVGSIQVHLGDDPKTVYMLENTGVGSGQLWKEHDLFDSINAALAECGHRNESLP